MRDAISNIAAVTAIAPAVQSATVTGAGIDTFGCNRLAFILATGAIVSSGDFTASVQESDDNATYTDAAAGVIDTDAPATLEAASSYRIGYRGFKRYARLVLTKNGGTSIGASATAIKSDLATRPAS